MQDRKTVNIHNIFESLSDDITRDLFYTDKELEEGDMEKRQWVRCLLSHTRGLSKLLDGNRYWINFLCCIQMMVTIFASLSLTLSAAANLSLMGLSGFSFYIAVASIAIMSLYTCVLTAIQNIHFGLNGNGLLRYQKLRSVEIKLFRAPDMPDALYGKTHALIEYMNYFSIEKEVLKAIKNVRAYNQRIENTMLNSEEIPIELKARMAFSMSGRRSASSDINQKRICRLIHRECSEMYDKINSEDVCGKISEDSIIQHIYTNVREPVITEGILRKLCPDTNCNADEWIAKVIVMHSLCRFAYFARKHGEELAQMLNKEKNGHWCQLGRKAQKKQMTLAFRWSIKQHLKRENKKMSNAYVGHFFMMNLAKYFILLVAIIPSGFSILSSSPVASIVGMIGRGWECVMCSWFWFCGAANYLITTRKDVEKIWAKICEFFGRTLLQKTSKNPEIEKHTWHFSSNLLGRCLIALSMATASAMFTVLGVKKLVENPSIVGGELMFHRLFVIAAPWLRPIFIPLCALLSFFGALLHYAHVTKYYSADRMPRPKRGIISQNNSGYWKRALQQIKYLWRHNFDLCKNSHCKILKAVGSCVAVLQTIVLYMSAQQILGQTLALLLIPGVLMVISATNRRCIESGLDLWHQACHSKFFGISLLQKYPWWFSFERKRRPSLSPRFPTKLIIQAKPGSPIPGASPLFSNINNDPTHAQTIWAQLQHDHVLTGLSDTQSVQGLQPSSVSRQNKESHSEVSIEIARPESLVLNNIPNQGGGLGKAQEGATNEDIPTPEVVEFIGPILQKSNSQGSESELADSYANHLNDEILADHNGRHDIRERSIDISDSEVYKTPLRKFCKPLISPASVSSGFWSGHTTPADQTDCDSPYLKTPKPHDPNPQMMRVDERTDEDVSDQSEKSSSVSVYLTAATRHPGKLNATRTNQSGATSIESLWAATEGYHQEACEAHGLQHCHHHDGSVESELSDASHSEHSQTERPQAYQSLNDQKLFQTVNHDDWCSDGHLRQRSGSRNRNRKTPSPAIRANTPLPSPLQWGDQDPKAN